MSAVAPECRIHSAFQVKISRENVLRKPDKRDVSDFVPVCHTSSSLGSYTSKATSVRIPATPGTTMWGSMNDGPRCGFSRLHDHPARTGDLLCQISKTPQSILSHVNPLTRMARMRMSWQLQDGVCETRHRISRDPDTPPSPWTKYIAQ